MTQVPENDPEPSEIPRDSVLISIAIVNFNAGPFLRAAIDSIVAQDIGGDRVEVVIVDNASTAPGLSEIEADYSECLDLKIVALDRNVGFARACNIGLQTGRGDLVLLMNPDCRLLPNALSAMRDALLDHGDAGIAGARLINPDGSEQRGARRDIPNPWLIFCEVLQLHRLMPDHPRFRSFNRHKELLPKMPTVVPAVSGACMMAKRQAFAEVGLLDGDYFLHFEDLDWCLRFDQAEWRVLFVPGATVEHTKGVCSASMPIRVAYEKHRSLIHFMRKHFTAFYPSSFMALVSLLVTMRFVVLAPRVWLRARVARTRRPRVGARVPVIRRRAPTARFHGPPSARRQQVRTAVKRVPTNAGTSTNLETARRLGRGLIRGGVLVAPFVIFASLPLFHNGIWYKSEPVIAALHAIGAIVAAGLGLAIAGNDRTAGRVLRHPFVMLPLVIALWGAVTAGMAAMPVVSWFGTPEFGQGIAWHLDFAVLVAGGMIVAREPRTRIWLAWSCGLAIAGVSAAVAQGDEGWNLTPFLFGDSLAFYGIFGAPLLLALIAARREAPIVATIVVALLVIVISWNRTALLLVLAAPFVAGLGWWLARRHSNAARPVLALLTFLAPIVVTAVIAFSDMAADEASLWSRKMHLAVARHSLEDNPADLVWGRGWGSYGERQLAYLPVGEFDLVGSREVAPEWDATHGQIHFQSHNFLVEALLSGGLVAMALTWATVVALPLFCRRRHIVLAGTLAVLAASMLAVWAPDAGAVPIIALAFAALAGPVALRGALMSLRAWLAVSLWGIAVLLVATAATTVIVGATMAREAKNNRDTAAATMQARDCRRVGRDFGRGGVHLATLYRSFSADLIEKRAAGGMITAKDVARMADYVCAVDNRIGDHASLRLANADLLVTAELASVLDDPALASIRDDRLSVWSERLRWYLERAPTRSDMAVPYLHWAFANGHEKSVATIAARLLARNRKSPVGLWFSGVVMMGEAETAAEGFDRMRRSLDTGIERIMPIDLTIVDQIKSAPQD